MTLHPQFIVDNAGRKKKVILSIKEYNELIELAQDFIDAAMADEVKDEPMVPLEEVVEKRGKRLAG